MKVASPFLYLMAYRKVRDDIITHRTMFSVFFRICFLLIFMMLSCCTNKISSNKKPDYKIQEFTLQEIDDILPNPLQGYAPWVGTENPHFETTLQYFTIEWNKIQPVSQNQYDWDAFEADWGEIEKTGKRVGFRISACTPCSGNPGGPDIPNWLSVPTHSYDVDNCQGIMPDWNHKDFLQAHETFLRNLGNRYNKDKRIAWIDIGSYGFWGEWHLYKNEGFAANETSKGLILEHYFQNFSDKLKVIAFDDSYALNQVVTNKGGIRNDCLGTALSNKVYEDAINVSVRNQVWRTAIITGEFCGSNSGAVTGTTDDFDLNFNFIVQNHWSFIGPAGGAIESKDSNHLKNLQKLHKILGYRFVLKTVSHKSVVQAGENLSVTLTLENKGIAPFYYAWPVVALLLDSTHQKILTQTLSIDIRTWLPGNTIMEQFDFHIPSQTPPGTYTVALTIPDPDFDRRGILFANTHGDSQGQYPVSEITIVTNL